MRHAIVEDSNRVRPSLSRRIPFVVVACLLAVVLGGTAWVGIRAVLAKSELEAAVPLASKLQSEIVAGQSGAAMATQNRLDAHAAAAAGYTGDPIWRAFEGVPFVGANLTAVRQIANIVNTVSKNALDPLAAIADNMTLSDFKPVNGAIDVKPLIAVRPQVARAAIALSAADRAARAVDATDTLPAVSAAIVKLRMTLVKASQAADVVNRAVQLIPAMLGATGPRNYLLLVQNPTELRASGGITGALALIHTDGGRVKLQQQASTADFPHYPTPVLPLAPETAGLYGDITGEYIQDVTLTPRFEQSAALAQEMWKRQFGVTVDGVISIDPVTLSYLLTATGPIIVPTGDVMDSGNAVRLLLSESYARYNNHTHQGAFFEAAAAAVFAGVSTGKFEPRALVTALSRASNEHRILLWSAHLQEQAVFADTTLAGGLPTSDASMLRFGVYFNDATGGKMGYYLDTKLGVGQAVCRNDGRSNYAVEVTLTNTAPMDAATSLKSYVTGGGVFGVRPGNVKTNVIFYGPVEVQGLAATRDGADLSYHLSFDDGRQVATTSVELSPGQSTTLRVNWLSRAPSKIPASIVSTPIIKLPKTQKLEFSCESALK